MKTSPKKPSGSFILTCSLLLASLPLVAGEPRSAALEDVSSGNFVTTPANGGLAVAAKAVSGRETFAIVDLTDGELEDGDTVKIYYLETVWNEGDKGIFRVSKRGASDDSTTFTIKKDGTNYKLKAPSGNFVAFNSEDNTALLTTSQEGEALSLNIIWDPAAESGQ